ncbi:MAG: hypothetical protein DRP10_00950 [Candidatus Aenigmatarchaeota archaeon]|nr:MAG: hypothetical protein DRP10_00950 [Candidatus Aenigmarchaeota archaeon]
MSNITTALGVLVLTIGLLGIFGWIYAYTQISSGLSTLAQAELTARSASSIPFIGVLVSSVTVPTADIISSIRTSITMFFFYNILLNIALIFSGIGLISVGRDTSYMTSRVRKIRKYLLKKKEEDKK